MLAQETAKPAAAEGEKRHVFVQVIAVLALTLAFTFGLLTIGPFKLAADGMVAIFAPGSSSRQVENYYLNPDTQEISRGDQPKVSFDRLAQVWSGSARNSRVMLMGNSQMMTMILAPGEPLPSTPEKTYPDHLIDHYRTSSPDIRFYRLAAPNLSYMEALWYLEYLLTRPELHPDVIMLQLNYESMRKMGIRDGMATLLGDPVFEAKVQALATENRLVYGIFGQTLEAYRHRAASAPVGTSAAAPEAKAGALEEFETQVRGSLDQLPWVWPRHELKYHVENFFYLSRVYLLGIKPTTPRSLSGTTLATSIDALEEFATLAKMNGIRVVLLNAPQNPGATLYKTVADQERYQDTIQNLSAKYGMPLYDFEHAIPAQEWGFWIDGKDPIHFGRAAHQRMAQLVLNSHVFDSILDSSGPSASNELTLHGR